jgi:hypothetical protein
VKAAENIIARLDARQIRSGEWRAKCPVHGGKSSSSLAITEKGDRVLIHCFSNCPFADILNALGATAAELFDGSRPPRRERLKRKTAAEGLRQWHNAEVLRVTRELRFRDQLAHIAHDGVQAGTLTEDEAWPLFEIAYIGRAELEHHFNRLQTESALELWREWRGKGGQHVAQ